MSDVGLSSHILNFSEMQLVNTALTTYLRQVYNKYKLRTKLVESKWFDKLLTRIPIVLHLTTFLV